MFNHEPKDYKCPLCEVASGKDREKTQQSDIVYRDEFITAFIAAKWWPNNPGHVIIISNNHFENLYDIPEDLLSKIYSFSKKVAIALKKTYKCDATSTRQHNEPAGNQDVWHFHVHVYPRYENDQLYQLHEEKRWTESKEREPYASKLKKYFQT